LFITIGGKVVISKNVSGSIFLPFHGWQFHLIGVNCSPKRANVSQSIYMISYVAASSSICYGLPYGAEICAGVENLYINQANGTVSGCLDLSAVILGVTVFDWKLGCFNIHVPKVGKVSAVIPGLSHEKLSSARSRTLISCS